MDENDLITLSDLLAGTSSESKRGPRKSRDKTHSKENKCMNEKRRREQENIYMEELAELLSASITDLNSFSSVKPDKCAILEETVNHIKRIKSEEGEHSDAVQQSHVSSSKPAVLANDVLGPLLLEALDGFLFVVNSQGKVEFASDNITQYLKYVPDDLVSKSIYNVIHVGDHAQFSSSLIPMSSGNCIPWPSENPNNKSRTFNCRMLIKSSEDNKNLEETPSQASQYENMQITAVLQPCEITETQTCLVCIARRINVTEKVGSQLVGIEQFTTKQDLQGKILACDTGGVNTQEYAYPEYVGEDINKFCHVNDLQQLQKHHAEVIANGSNTSGVYRFKLFESRYVFVQTKSKLFNNPSTGEPEFIMSTHSIVRECDTDSELKGSASTSLMKSIIGQQGHKNRELLKQFNNKSGNQAMGLSSSPLSSLMGGTQGFGNITQLLSSPDTNSNTNSVDTNPMNDLNWNDILDILPPTDRVGSWDNGNQGFANASSSKGFPSNANIPQAPSNAANGISVSPWGNINNSMNSMSANNVAVGMNNRTMMPNVGQQTPSGLGVMRGNPRLILPQPRISGYGQPHSAAGYPNQRSPGFSPSPRRSPGPYHPLNRMSGFPNRPPTPGSAGIHPGVQSPIQSPMPSPLQALESMEKQVPRDPKSLEQLKQLQNSRRNASVKMDQAKLKKLLMVNSDNFVNKDSTSMNLRNVQAQQLQSLGLSAAMLPPKSEPPPTPTSLQSPRSVPHPSPALSSPQQPQSTSADDHPDSSSKETDPSAKQREDNTILKQLLNAEDDDEEGETSGEQATSTVPEKEEKSNEAEPRTDNKLLIKLLEDTKGVDSNLPSNKNHELLQKLLRDEADSNTIEESDEKRVISSQAQENGCRLPTTSSTSSLNQLLSAPSNTKKNAPDKFSFLDQLTLLSSSLPGSPGVTLEGVSNKEEQQFQSLLSLWDRDQSDSGSDVIMPSELKRKPVKRKISDSETSVHSTNSSEVELLGSRSTVGSTPSEKNVLLAKLLSKNANKDSPVRSQLDVCAVPQNKLPKWDKNMVDKIQQMRGSEIKAANVGSGSLSRANSDSNIKWSVKTQVAQNNFENNWDNPRTNPNAPFPGNTKENPGLSPQLSVPGGLEGSLLDLSPSPSVGTTGNNLQGAQGNLMRISSSQNLTTPSVNSLSRPSSNSGRSSDPMLSQILQQASDLQRDMGQGPLAHVQNPINLDQPVTDDSSLFSQLESVLSDAQLSELDLMLGIGQPGTDNPPNRQSGSMSEQMEIEMIQQHLMNDMPQTSMPGTAGSRFGDPKMDVVPVLRDTPGHMVPNPSKAPNTPTPLTPGGGQPSQGGGGGSMHNAMAVRGVMGARHGDMTLMTSQLRQLHANHGDVMALLHDQQRSPRFAPTPGVPGMNPGPTNPSSLQVRQTLFLHQQRQKQAAIRQRALLQQRQQQGGFPGPLRMPSQGGLGFPQMPSPGIPDNFTKMMDATLAPNVSIQRNSQLPGPMGGQFQGNHGSMSPMLRASTPTQNRMSPFGPGGAGPGSQTSPAAPGGPQWTQRANPAMMNGGSVAQSPQYVGMRPRHISPNAAQQMGGGDRFVERGTAPFHQQMHMMQARQMAQQQGLTSPINPPQSPFPGTQPDPMLMSPHSSQNMSPASQISPQQMKPGFSPGAGSLSSGAVSPNYGGPNQAMGMQQANFGSLSGGMGGNFSPEGRAGPPTPLSGQDMFSAPGQGVPANLKQKSPGAGSAQSTASDFVKKQVRGFITSKNQQHQQQVPPISGPQGPTMPGDLSGVSVSMGGSMAPGPQMSMAGPLLSSSQMSLDPSEGELPMNVLETLSELTGGQVDSPMTQLLQESKIRAEREQARGRYEQFKQLSFQGGQDEPHLTAENKKAHNYFRTQLLSTGNTPPVKSENRPGDNVLPVKKADTIGGVNVLHLEPRVPMEDIRPVDQSAKNSLLQQLLSDNS